MVLKNARHSGGFYGAMVADGDSLSDRDGDDSSFPNNVVALQHGGAQSSSPPDNETLLGQTERRIAATNSNKSNTSKHSDKSSSIAEEIRLSRPLIASYKRDQRNLVQHSGGNSSNIYEDRNSEFTKHSRNLEVSNDELISSSDDKYDAGDEKIFDESDQIHAPPVSKSPESDVEEEDVKVCDICGDAGREDLLAICSRCSDGAEHTYCMREKLDKVPEGDWLCEECKCNELLEAQKVDHIKKLGSHERSKYLGRTSSLLSDTTLKLDKDPFCERPMLRNNSLNRQASSRRFGERTEPCPTTKKQALESPIGSPTTSGPNRSRMGVLCKNGSSKNWDRMGKPNNQISTGTDTTCDSSENARSPSANSPHALKGNFLKSNSFSSSTSKQNVKVSDDILQKQGNDPKDGLGKSISKSMSFKGLGRLNSVEPRVKMLPAKCAPVQDLKAHKHGRDHTSCERKNIIKLDHSLPGHTKLSRGIDSISTLSVTNPQDYKNVQMDVKMPNMSKHAGHSDQKSSNVMMNIGEVTKLSSEDIVGSTSVSGASNAFETKLNHLNVNDGLMISSRFADGTLTANEVRADVLDTRSEKAPENFSSHSRQSLNSRMVSGSRRRLPPDASVLKTKDGLHEENKLKAAIEAAMQKKQDISKKNKIPVKPNDFPISNAQRCHGGDAASNQVRDSMSEEAMHEGDMDLRDSNSSKQIPISSTKQIKFIPSEFENSPVELSVLTVSASPEQESVWQGGFEIHRNGKLPDICGGFQAHMSTYASGKVLEVVGKLPQKIVFNEVPRPCAWPLQFKEHGAQEDNIALYFFAKDTESYTRSYKVLVDYMMKYDLALKGNISGVELLVFPSNHLPHQSKCWNALYFIWGVVRGRRQRFPDNKICGLGKCEVAVSNKVVPDKDVMLTENPCLNKSMADQFSISDTGHNIVSRCEVPVISGSSLQCASLSNGYCQKEEGSVNEACVISPNGTGNHDKRPRNDYTSLGAACPDSETAALRDYCQENLNRFRKHQKSTRDVNGSNNVPSELMLDNDDNHLSVKLPVGKQEGDDFTLVNLQALGTESDCVNTVKFDNSVKQEKPCLDNTLKNVQMKLKDDNDQRDNMNYVLKNGVKLDPTGDLKAKDCVDINVSVDSNADSLNRLQDFHNIHSFEDSIGATSCGAVATTCQKRPWEDMKDTLENENLAPHSKNMKGFDSFSGCSVYGPPPFGERLDPKMGGMSFCSHKVDTSEAGNEKPIATNPTSAEESSFLVDSHPGHNIEPGDGFLRSEVALSENEDHLLGGSPNLELALGVKKKQAREGFLRFFTGFNRNDLDRPADIVGSSEGEDGDANASLSLSLGFPFSDRERVPRAERPPSTAEQTVPARQEINSPLLLFRGSSGK